MVSPGPGTYSINNDVSINGEEETYRSMKEVYTFAKGKKKNASEYDQHFPSP